MDGMGLLLIVMGILLLVFVCVFAYAAVMRINGRRTRFDPLIETFIRAQGAAVYPPSLRPDNPEPQPIIEEVDRADRGTHATPGTSAKPPAE